jgi:hypothetical protein
MRRSVLTGPRVLQEAAQKSKTRAAQIGLRRFLFLAVVGVLPVFPLPVLLDNVSR